MYVITDVVSIHQNWAKAGIDTYWCSPPLTPIALRFWQFKNKALPSFVPLPYPCLLVGPRSSIAEPFSLNVFCP